MAKALSLQTRHYRRALDGEVKCSRCTHGQPYEIPTGSRGLCCVYMGETDQPVVSRKSTCDAAKPRTLLCRIIPPDLGTHCLICGAPGLFRDGQPCEHHPSLGVLLISAERTRQVQKEGYTPERDTQHKHSEMAQAAAYYSCRGGRDSLERLLFPEEWSTIFAKREGFPIPTDKDLIKAGALIAAELDRRAALQMKGG